MIAYQPTDTIPISDFELAWRITDPRWSTLPDRVLQRIKPLSTRKSTEVLGMSPFLPDVGRHFDPVQYRAGRQASLGGEGASKCERVKKWLRELPVSPDQDVYLAWQLGNGVAAATDWSTFVEVWDDLWYPFDRLCVFDETRQWGVLLGPEEQAVYVERAID